MMHDYGNCVVFYNIIMMHVEGTQLYCNQENSHGTSSMCNYSASLLFNIWHTDSYENYDGATSLVGTHP